MHVLCGLRPDETDAGRAIKNWAAKPLRTRAVETDAVGARAASSMAAPANAKSSIGAAAKLR